MQGACEKLRVFSLDPRFKSMEIVILSSIAYWSQNKALEIVLKVYATHPAILRLNLDTRLYTSIWSFETWVWTEARDRACSNSHPLRILHQRVQKRRQG